MATVSRNEVLATAQAFGYKVREDQVEHYQILLDNTRKALAEIEAIDGEFSTFNLTHELSLAKIINPFRTFRPHRGVRSVFQMRSTTPSAPGRGAAPACTPDPSRHY